MIYLDLFSTGLFAMVGAQIMLGLNGAFLFVVLAATLSAIGGGTTREWLLFDGELFWQEDVRYLLVIVFSVLLSYSLQRSYLKATHYTYLLNHLGTATFVVVGIIASLNTDRSFALGITMGTLTGIGGGILRDCLLINRQFTAIDVVNLYTTATCSSVATGLLLLGINQYLCVFLVFIILCFAPGLSTRQQPLSSMLCFSLATSTTVTANCQSIQKMTNRKDG